MDIILVPGLWLKGETWDNSTQQLQAAGHALHKVTLPGRESEAAAHQPIGLRDQVGAVVEFLDSLPGQAVLVGHSGGGAIIHGVGDLRPEKIKHNIYVDSMPLGNGSVINDQLPIVDGVIPFPDWSAFEEDDLIDLTPEIREQMRAVAVPEPAAVATDPANLTNPQRYEVPATVICCEFTAEQAREIMGNPDHPWFKFGEEASKVKSLNLVELPTGHWPQFSKPQELDTLLTSLVEAV